MTAALASQGVQYGTVTIASGAASGTAAINAMGSGGFLLWGGETASQAGVIDAQSLAGLSISGGTITCTRNTSGANTVTSNFIAVDGDTTNLIKSVNFGTVTLTSGQSTANATIPSVTTGNTAVAHLGVTTAQSALAINTVWPIWSVGSATTIAMTCNTSGGSPTGYFCAMEFQSAALTSLQAISDSAAPSVTTRTHTITSVTQGNTFTIFAGCYSSGTSTASGDQYGQITANTTLTIGTSSAPFLTIVYNCFIINLASALVETSAQRGLISIAAGTSGTATLSPTMNTAHTINSYCGNSSSGTNLNTILGSDTLTNSSTVTGNFNASTTGKISWEAIALNPAAAVSTEDMSWFSRAQDKLYFDPANPPQHVLWTPDNSPQQLPRTVEWLGVLKNKIYLDPANPPQKNLWTPDNSLQQLQRTIEWMLPAHRMFPDEVNPRQKILWTPDNSPQQLQRTTEWLGALKNKIYYPDPPIYNPAWKLPYISPQQLQREVDWMAVDRNIVYNFDLSVRNRAWTQPDISPQQKAREIDWQAAQRNKIYYDPAPVFNPSPWEPAMLQAAIVPPADVTWLPPRNKIYNFDLTVANRAWPAPQFSPQQLAREIDWLAVDRNIVYNFDLAVNNRAWTAPYISPQQAPPGPSTDFSWFTPPKMQALLTELHPNNNAPWAPGIDTAPPVVLATARSYRSTMFRVASPQGYW